MSTNIGKPLVKIDLRCSACGAPGSGSCDCGVGYLPAGKVAAKAAQDNPGISSRALAAQSGVSQRTAANALRAAREQFRSSDTFVLGRDGKRYPTTKTSTNWKPARFLGDIDLPAAQAYVRQAVMAVKPGLRPAEWQALVQWLKEERWEIRH